MNNHELFYALYQNYINPFYYIYNKDNILILSGWIVYKKNMINKNMIYKRWLLFENELDLYFSKKLKYFTIKTFNLYEINSFSNNVYNIIKNIPFGEILSYQDVAVKLNNLKSVRAVGNICRKNFYPLVIPCHRIVSKNGIGGYMGKNYCSIEQEIKKMLLKHENVFS